MNRERTVPPFIDAPTHSGGVQACRVMTETAIHTVTLAEGSFAAIVNSLAGGQLASICILDRDEVEHHIGLLRNAMEDAERIDQGLAPVHAPDLALPLPDITETTFGGFVSAVYGYGEKGAAAAAGDGDVADMIEWTSDDPEGPKIGWDERVFYWENDDHGEVLWRHRPEAGDLDEHGNLTAEAVARRGV